MGVSLKSTIGLGVAVAATATGAYLTNKAQKEAEKESELVSDMGVRGSIKYRSGQSEGEGFSAVGTSISSFINNRSVITGASKSWDPKRILDGKIEKFKQIGAEGVRLFTSTGDRIFGCHFSLENFHNKIQKMGGRFCVLDLHLDHPFLKVSEDVIVINERTNQEYAASRVPYSRELENSFRNPQEFLDFCQRMGLQVVWEDTLSPFEPTSWYQWSSRQQNVLVFSRGEIGRLRYGGAIEPRVEVRPEGGGCGLSDLRPCRSRAIVFEGNRDQVKQLFAGDGDQDRGLKIEGSAWKMLEYNGKTYLVKTPEAERLLSLAADRNIGTSPLFRMNETGVNPAEGRENSGVVVLSMNQSNSFASYSHEILTFLFNGVNVFAYDNAGKGLSRGKNSEAGMTATLRGVGEFLRDTKGFRQEQVMYKGQCAGGPPSSHAGVLFPDSHVWVDQAPRNYAETAANMASVKSEDLRERAERQEDSYLARGVQFIASYLPSLSPGVQAVSSCFVPSYDVINDLQQNRGMHIYTIGVPDEGGFGGDQLVSVAHVEAIRHHLGGDKRGLFLPMPGATHVTDWWRDSNTLQRVKGALDETHLRADAYAVKMAGGQAMVEQKFQALIGKEYNDDEAIHREYNLHALLEAALEGSVQDFDLMIADVWYDESKEFHRDVVLACMDIAEEAGRQEMLVCCLEYKRKYT